MKLGMHVVADLLQCCSEALNNRELIERTLVMAAKKAKLQVIKVMTHRFKPKGISCIVLIRESHISLHTWPEHGFAAVDIFICEGEPDKALEVIKETLKPRQTMVIKIERGIALGRKVASWTLAH